MTDEATFNLAQAVVSCGANLGPELVLFWNEIKQLPDLSLTGVLTAAALHVSSSSVSDCVIDAFGLVGL